MSRRAQGVCRELDVVVGDAAYGGAGLHEETHRAIGIDALAPPSKRICERALFGIDEFELDMRSRDAVPNKRASRALEAYGPLRLSSARTPATAPTRLSPCR